LALVLVRVKGIDKDVIKKMLSEMGVKTITELSDELLAIAEQKLVSLWD